MIKRNSTIPSLFTLPDIRATIKFYEDIFGFSKTAEWKDESAVVWAEVKRQDTTIWFFANPLEHYPSPVFSGLIYIFVENVDEIADSIEGRAEISWGPVTQDYGLRELGLKDNNGYYIVFAKDAA